MHSILRTIISCCVLSFVVNCTVQSQTRNDAFEIRGVLPWHNFLSGPSSWNEKDYEHYLDECVKNKINFIGFHNYTGGGQRYATYVEPMIKISYKGIVPQAFFDNSLSSRWGYLPLALKNFTPESLKAFDLPQGAKAFGSTCSVLATSNDDAYSRAQDLMKKVLKMAHDRHIKMAMGFEFGVLPPEYFSLNASGNSFYWPGESNMIPNPTHPTAIELHDAALDNILETYPDIDYIWMWLNEHSFMSVDFKAALKDPRFAKIYAENAHYFTEAKTDEERFIGVWALEYMKLTYEHLKQKGSKAKLILGGWGGGNQLPILLRGLDRALPKEIVFSCLNPSLGLYPQPEFLEDIAKNRKVWAIPWLEGDHQLWHFQPRVQMISDQVKLAKKQNLNGVLAIHWRTVETKYNMQAFAYYASNPSSTKTTLDLYNTYFKSDMGNEAAKKLVPLIVKMDVDQLFANIPSPEYYQFTPEWGQMDTANVQLRTQICEAIDRLLLVEKDAQKRLNLSRFGAMFKFELLLNTVDRAMQPAFELKNNYFTAGTISQAEAESAYEKLINAPVEEMIRVYASKVSSRGEMGELSSINQRLCSEYKSLKLFLEQHLQEK